MPERFKVVCIPCKALYKCSDFSNESVHKRCPMCSIFTPVYSRRSYGIGWGEDPNKIQNYAGALLQMDAQNNFMIEKYQPTCICWALR